MRAASSAWAAGNTIAAPVSTGAALRWLDSGPEPAPAVAVMWIAIVTRASQNSMLCAYTEPGSASCEIRAT